MEKRLPLPTGTVLQGRYRIMRQLGHGGFGAVYEAVDDEIGKSFALKETFYAANEELRQAFKREARMLASLEHDAFPNVSHYFTEGEGCFLVMELIRGDDLDKLLSQRAAPFEQAQVLTWAEQLLDALQDLHAGGIIHRDIKPSNLKLTPKGRIKLLDFGIAKGALEGETTVLTTVGSLAAATLQYAPLEQVLKASVQYQMMLSVVSADKVIEILKHGTTAASDFYALAATLYQLLTKQLPADAATRALAIWSGQADRLIPAHEVNPQVSPEVSAVLQKAMGLDRHERYQSAAEMQQMLRAATTPVAAPTQPAPSEPLPTVKDLAGQITQPNPRPFVAEPLKTIPATMEVPLLPKQPKTKERTYPPATEVLHPDTTPKAPLPETVLSPLASDASLPETTLVSPSPVPQTAPRRTERRISSILIWMLAAGISFVIGYGAYDFAKKFVDLRDNNLYETDYKAWEKQHVLTNIIHFSTFFLVAILTFIACVFIVRWWNRRIKQP